MNTLNNWISNKNSRASPSLRFLCEKRCSAILAWMYHSLRTFLPFWCAILLALIMALHWKKPKIRIIKNMSEYSPNFTMRQLLEAGVHYGHKKNFWNPKMAQYIYGVRSGIHIIDLEKTYKLLAKALENLQNVAVQNGRILFVGTKKQGSDAVAEHAKRCGQYYVNYRWLPGMLTNRATIQNSINKLKEYEGMLNDPSSLLLKKEKLELSRKHQKLELALGGIRNLGGLPNLIFALDTRENDIAIQEAKKLKIPVVAIVDTNAQFDGVDYIIPGNDDARKSIELYCKLAADAILQGVQISLAKSGVDIGAMSETEFVAPQANAKPIKNTDANSEQDSIPEDK